MKRRKWDAASAPQSRGAGGGPVRKSRFCAGLCARAAPSGRPSFLQGLSAPAGQTLGSGPWALSRGRAQEALYRSGRSAGERFASQREAGAAAAGGEGMGKVSNEREGGGCWSLRWMRG